MDALHHVADAAEGKFGLTNNQQGVFYHEAGIA